MTVAGKAKHPIKQLCDERGLKYTWLARQIGIRHLPSFDQMLGGTRRKPPLFFERIAAILHVPLSAVKEEGDE